LLCVIYLIQTIPIFGRAKKMEKKKKKYLHKLRSKFRLVILNDETFEEKVSLKLSRMNVFVFFGGSIILLIIGMITLIAFTPLREYIPGYASTELRREALKLAIRADSLEQRLALNNQQLRSIQNIINGEIPMNEMDTATEQDIAKPDAEELEASEKENDLRTFVDEEDRFNIPSNPSALSHFSFFTPVKGMITGKYNLQEDHPAVDIVADKNAPVKSCLSGTVLMAEWTSQTGYVMVIQHNQNLISIYKHNSALLKKQGDLVRTGEVIAIIGNSGEQSTGPHLHFELWHMGIPVNPENFIAF